MASRLAHYRRGVQAEYLAAFFLMMKGYRILAMRMRTPMGEVDLLARHKNTLVLVEVKARKRMEDALAAITPLQQKRLLAAARFLMTERRYVACVNTRFDAMCLAPFIWPRHIVNAWGEK